MNGVVILCTGPSAAGIVPDVAAARDRGVHVIGVNGALEHATAALSSWFTLDASAANRIRMSYPVPGIAMTAALPDYMPSPSHVRRYWRMTGPGILSARDGLSEDPAGIHTGNSGYGALGLAYHMRAAGLRRIAILGLDATPGGYFYGGLGPSGRMDHLPALFASAIPQLSAAGIEVVNGSPESAITCFPRMPPREALRWIGERLC